MKACPGCGLTKAEDHFYRYANGRLYHRCKPCIAVCNKEQNIKHKEKRNAYDSARGSGWDRSGREPWSGTERDKHNNYLLRTYGITIDQYDEMLESQDGVCAICKQACNRWTTKRLCVDHDHSTGRVRGLLCFQCNVGLGKFKDSATNLQSAVQYMEKTA